MDRQHSGRGPDEPADLVAAACAGDRVAFGTLVEGYRRELRAHCCRLLGSPDDADDMVQETFLRAWRKRGTYQARSTFRAWLYRIATNCCVDHLDRHPRVAVRSRPEPDTAEAPARGDPLAEPAAPAEAEPEFVVVARETIELAFLAALRHLPTRQRAVLVLRDVLGWSAREAAGKLDGSVTSANSILQRARSTLKKHLPDRRADWARVAEPTEDDRELVRRYMDALERADLEALADVLRCRRMRR